MGVPEDSSLDAEKVFVEHYMVAFVDLLGQQEELSKMVSLPSKSEPEEYEKFIEVLKKTIGSVKSLQKDAKIFFDAFTKEKENSLINIFPGFEKTQPRQIKFQHFSDGLVIYVPLGNNHKLSAISAVYGVLLACGYLTLLGLAQKRPVRIGISVGLGTEVDDEIYGKVLADAYIAESKIAQMPRAVVTNDVLDYINFKSNGEVEGIGEKFEALLAGECKKLLSYDYDGHVIVDYLSDDFTNLLIKGGGLSETIIPEAYKFIQEQLELHQSQQNSKLAMRYSLLHGYFSEHLGK